MDPQIPHPDIGAAPRLDSMREQPFPPPHIPHSPLDHWPSPPAAHAHHLNSKAMTASISNSISSSISNSHLGYPSNSLSPNKEGLIPTTSTSPNAINGVVPPSSSDVHDRGCNSSLRPNQVDNVILHGVAIVSLMIDNKERLCLAQISNTLLKDYSYNEIHNRRVALGITCVQCTPVQLEILRRAGAMPVSSRRCGMITKREAERLVKSFLEDNAPPKLPEDFAFDVYHECGWGCRGFFEPSRYNSSRAKCIKCSYCNMYFSPNKFIFHFHRTPGSKYNHPDAANFNSWRRHLKLFVDHDKEEVTHKWEDVKAMFNGGTRKRILSSSAPTSSSSSSSSSIMSLSSSSSSSSQSITSPKFSSHLTSSHPTMVNHPTSYSRHPPPLDGASSIKKAKTSHLLDAAASTFLPKPAPFSTPFNPYGWLAASHGKNPYPFMAMNSTQSMCFGFPPQLPSSKDALVERMKTSPVGVTSPASWMNRNPAGPLQFASMDLLWDKTFGFPPAAAVAALGFRNGGYPAPVLPGAAPPMSLEANDHNLSPVRDDTACISPNINTPQNIITSSHDRGDKRGDRMSAFTRVVPSMSSPSSLSLSPANDDSRHHISPHSGEENEPDIDRADNDNQVCDNCDEEDPTAAPDVESQRDMEDLEEIDVEVDVDDKKKRRRDDSGDDEDNRSDNPDIEDSDRVTSLPPELPFFEHSHKTYSYAEKTHETGISQDVSSTEPTADKNDSATPRAHDCNANRQENQTPPVLTGPDSGLSEELCESLKTEVESRRKRELEVNVLKETFREEVTREKSFREHMAQQLEMLRETLTTELEQERKIRFSLQEKLKQAHDALNSFSCGILTAGGEGVPFKDAKMIPR